MGVIVVAAGESDRRLGELLGSEPSISVLYVQTASACFAGAGPDVVFVQHPEASRIACENAVLVVRRSGHLPESSGCENAVVILDSSRIETLEQVARRHLPALTCGLSGADTFTLSSLTADSAVISLQRAITAFDGSVVEPFELPVVLLGHTDPFTLLSCAAIFCLLGAQNPLANQNCWRIPARKAKGTSSSCC